MAELVHADSVSSATGVAKLASLTTLIGTSGVVYPAASLPYYAKQRGAKIIEINPERTAFSTISDYTLLGKACELLPQAAETLTKSNIP